jgi:HSP20 family protein
MALIRWEPAREINSLQHEMNRLFNTFFETPAGAPDGGNVTRRWIPAMDLVESEDHFVLRADLPGVAESDVELSLDDRVLTVSGERKDDHEGRSEGYYRLERPTGSFSRSLTLPEGVDGDAITATFDRGVLEVRVPKPAEQKPRKLQIKVGESLAAIEGRAVDQAATS